MNVTKNMSTLAVRCFLTAFALVLCVSTVLALDGPDVLAPGQFAVYTSETMGDWAVFPDCSGSYAKDSNGKGLYLSILEEGTFSIVHFAVVDGKPEISVKTIHVAAASPNPKPLPSPEPKPDGASEDFGLSAEEKRAVIETVEQVLASIESGQTRTPQGARYLLKTTLIQRVGTCDMTGCRLPERVNKALATWETRMDLKSMDGMKNGLAQVLEGLK